MDDIVSRVGGAILLAETEWTPKAGVSKERAMALAAIEAMREPSKKMVLEIAAADWRGSSDLNWSDGWRIMIDAALKP